MISICQIYNDFKGANNTWKMGHFRPMSFEYALHEAQLEIFNELRKEWEKSQIVDDNLRPFFKSSQIAIKNFAKGGIISYPPGYSTFSSLRFFSKTEKGAGVQIVECDTTEDKLCRELREEEKVELANADELIERAITKINNQRWGSVCDHQFIGPSIEDPYCTQYNDGFKVLPKKIGFVVLDFLAIPERPKFLYTRDAKHNIICSDDCKNLLWGEEILPELMSRLKTKYASFTSNPQKYAEGVKETEIVGS